MGEILEKIAEIKISEDTLTKIIEEMSERGGYEFNAVTINEDQYQDLKIYLQKKRSLTRRMGT